MATATITFPSRVFSGCVSHKATDALQIVTPADGRPNHRIVAPSFQGLPSQGSLRVVTLVQRDVSYPDPSSSRAIAPTQPGNSGPPSHTPPRPFLERYWSKRGVAFQWWQHGRFWFVKRRARFFIGARAGAHPGHGQGAVRRVRHRVCTRRTPDARSEAEHGGPGGQAENGAPRAEAEHGAPEQCFEKRFGAKTTRATGERGGQTGPVDAEFGRDS